MVSNINKKAMRHRRQIRVRGKITQPSLRLSLFIYKLGVITDPPHSCVKCRAWKSTAFFAQHVSTDVRGSHPTPHKWVTLETCF